jgi:hypothetical protein
VTDDEWTKSVMAAFELRKTDPDTAVARLRTLSRQASSSGRKYAGVYHATQALGLAAAVLSQAGRHREAARAFQRVAKLHKGSLRQHGHSLGSSLAAASLELFEAGQPDPATRLAWEALRMFGQYPDPSSVHEKIIRRLRTHLNEKSKRGRGHAG